MQRQTMKRELMSEDELRGILRENGVDGPANVKQCYLEGCGNASVIEKEK